MPNHNLFLLHGLAFATVAVSAPAAADEEPSRARATLAVEISNIQSDDGQVGCSLFSKKEGFPSKPEKADAKTFVQPKAGQAICVFEDVKPGKYAVSVMHDEDKDGQLKTSVVGRPKEWWGVSNNVPAERFGPPKYESATFDHDGKGKTIQIRLRL